MRDRRMRRPGTRRRPEGKGGAHASDAQMHVPLKFQHLPDLIQCLAESWLSARAAEDHRRRPKLGWRSRGMTPQGANKTCLRVGQSGDSWHNLKSHLIL